MARARRILKAAKLLGRVLNKTTKQIGKNNRKAAASAGKAISNKRAPALKPKAPGTGTRKPAPYRSANRSSAGSNIKAPAAKSPTTKANKPLGSDFNVTPGTPSRKAPAASQPQRGRTYTERTGIPYRDQPHLSPGENRRARQAHEQREFGREVPGHRMSTPPETPAQRQAAARAKIAQQEAKKAQQAKWDNAAKRQDTVQELRDYSRQVRLGNVDGKGTVVPPHSGRQTATGKTNPGYNQDPSRKTPNRTPAQPTARRDATVVDPKRPTSDYVPYRNQSHLSAGENKKARQAYEAREFQNRYGNNNAPAQRTPTPAAKQTPKAPAARKPATAPAARTSRPSSNSNDPEIRRLRNQLKTPDPRISTLSPFERLDRAVGAAGMGGLIGHRIKEEWDKHRKRSR